MNATTVARTALVVAWVDRAEGDLTCHEKRLMWFQPFTRQLHQTHIIDPKILHAMKIPSNLLGAMLLTATLGVTATSCTSSKVVSAPGENSQIQISPIQTIVGKVNTLFCPRQEPCPTCGMG